MKNYRVAFAIDVNADTSAEACQQAWQLMTQPDALLPVGMVLDPASGISEEIDLQDLADNKE